MNERLEAYIYGRVQMVMYRDFAQRKASGLKLTGTVQNLPDGRVLVVAEGTRERLEKYLAKLHRGSLLAHVEKVEEIWLPATGEFKKFVISYV
ncbi:MAG: acylphosphatase [Parcubacteria group bacterium]|nr:acylphosphatase [Parcubacteria group bacterium]